MKPGYLALTSLVVSTMLFATTNNPKEAKFVKKDNLQMIKVVEIGNKATGYKMDDLHGAIVVTIKK